MDRSIKIRVALLALIALFVVGCESPPPYVQRPYEINRDLPTFPDGPEIIAGSEFNVCYAKSSARPDDIRKLANAECAKSGLSATLVEQTLNICPLSTPVAAIFRCGGAVASKSGNSTDAVTQIPFVPAPRPAGLGRPIGSIGAADVSTTAKSVPFPTYLFNDGQTPK